MFSIVAVPEPSTWTMTLIAFAGVAWAAACRRRTRAALASGEAAA
jgi:hypothetical protein